jgi:hypothetical protein
VSKATASEIHHGDHQVVLKSTDFKKDSIQLKGFCMGGTSEFDPKDMYSGQELNTIRRA